MAKERMFDFCTSCRKETAYKLCKKTVQKVIKDKVYEFEITIAVCDECGNEMDIPGILDTNVKAIDERQPFAAQLAAVIANKAKPETLNRVTGAVLVILGIAIFAVTKLK
mgnify:CR=1 FL=1